MTSTHPNPREGYTEAREGLELAAETLRRLQVVRNHAWGTAVAALDGAYGHLDEELREAFAVMLDRIEDVGRGTL